MMKRGSVGRLTGGYIVVFVGALVAAAFWLSPSIWIAVVLSIIVVVAFVLGIAYGATRGENQLRDLRRRIGSFVETGERDSAVTPPMMSPDLARLYDAFDQLTRVSVADEMRAKQSLHDRNILIREVHHRVKNNLQLMSSILSLHIHDAKDAATKATLRQIQERVNSLGTVHTDLYQNSLSGALPVAGLLHEIADSAEKLSSSLGHDISIERRIAHANLLPDQVVPLSLLVSEALSAVMRAARPRSVLLQFEVAEKSVVLVQSEGDVIDPYRGDITPQFMQVLATQLDGELEESSAKGHYQMTFSFPAPTDSEPVT